MSIQLSALPSIIPTPTPPCASSFGYWEYLAHRAAYYLTASDTECKHQNNSLIYPSSSPRGPGSCNIKTRTGRRRATVIIVRKAPLVFCNSWHVRKPRAFICPTLLRSSFFCSNYLPTPSSPLPRRRIHRGCALSCDPA